MSTVIETPVGDLADSPARARILAAASDVFGEYGFTKATIQDIAARAHVSRPLFYRRFRNKQDVFEAVVDRVFTDWRETLVAGVEAAPGGIVDALARLFVDALAYGRRRPLLSRLLNRDAQLLLATQSDVWDRACDALRSLISELLRQGVAAGEIRSDQPIEVMADLLTEIHFAFANRQLHSGVGLEERQAWALADCMLGGVVARNG
jgi:AcrR family transcriptional regulator